MTASSARSGSFTRRVSAVFSTKVVAFAISLATTLVISRVLGPAGKGEYVAVLAVPGLLGAIGVFGLPSAVNYFSARGTSVRGLLEVGLILTAILSAILIALVWISMPWLEQVLHWVYPTAIHVWYVPGGGKVIGSTLDRSTADMVEVVLIVIPAALLTTFAASVLYGRQQVRTYSAILIGQGAITLVLSTLLVAVFRFGVPGAVASSIVVTWLAAAADVVAVGLLARRMPPGSRVSYRGLAGYGFKVYPASITSYFNYRIDTYIIQAVMLSPEAPLGLYSMAVTMAELIFYVPDSVTMIFLPRVAGLPQAEADALLPRVSRLTVLMTVLAALALVPTAWLGIHLVLPNSTTVSAFYVLLPAVISLSVSKVMSSYVAGRGRPGPISVGSVIAVCVNIAANLILIPIYGIVGASLASLISYTASAAILLAVACRLSRHSLWQLIVPRGEEVRILVAGARRGLARARQVAGGLRAGTSTGGAS